MRWKCTSRKGIAAGSMENTTTERRWKVLRNALKRAAIVTLFRDEVFFNTRSGERFFMNRLWHNHPPLEVEKTYSVVPGYTPPIYIYDDMDRIAFNDSTLKAVPWPGEEINSVQPKLGECIVMGKYLSSYQEDTMTVEMAKAVLSKTELYKRQFEILTDVEDRM